MTSPRPAIHAAGDCPRILVVDGSRVVRMMIGKVLDRDVPDARVVACGSGAEALQALEAGPVDLVITALRLPDMDGQALAARVRGLPGQPFMPIIAVSGDVQERLLERSLGDDITDYFDKALGYEALAAFIRGHVGAPDPSGGHVLYIEDSRVVAMATRRMLERHGLQVKHVTSVEDALALLETDRARTGQPGCDLVLTDVYLKGGLTGHDLLRQARNDLGWGRDRLPILVMTGDENPANQSALLRAGANDLVEKPIEERLLVTKVLFQLRVGRMLRERAGVAPAPAAPAAPATADAALAA